MLWLYALVVLVFAVALWGVYKILGTPSKLTPADYALVLADVAASVERSAAGLRQALQGPAANVPAVASSAKKIFQTGYYQTLRLRPLSGPDQLAVARELLGRACEAYDWASRMAASESLGNPLIRAQVTRLLDAGEVALTQAGRELPASLTVPRESTAPSP